MDNQSFYRQQLRPATAKAILALARPLIDLGVVTAAEYNIVHDALMAVAKNGKTDEVKPQLIDGKKAAEMLGISYAQFRTLEAEGAFPFKRKTLGSKTVRYYLPDIVRYMQQTGENENE